MMRLERKYYYGGQVGVGGLPGKRCSFDCLGGVCLGKCSGEMWCYFQNQTVPAQNTIKIIKPTPNIFVCQHTRI